jgi:hypothetical protein
MCCNLCNTLEPLAYHTGQYVMGVGAVLYHPDAMTHCQVMSCPAHVLKQNRSQHKHVVQP